MAHHAPDERIERFEAGFHGDLIRPDDVRKSGVLSSPSERRSRSEDADYDDARAVWNGMIDKYPALIARCRGVADVVTAVNFARENALLVAVRVEFDLHEVGPEVATCLVFYSGDRMAECLRPYREYVASAPAEVSTLTLAGVMPDEELFPSDVVDEGKIGIVGCHTGSTEDGERALRPLRDLGEPIADFSGTMPYVELQRLFDEDYPDGMRYYWKSLYLDDLSDSTIDRIASWTDVAPSPLSTIDVWQLGGEIARIDAEDTAFAGRYAPFLLCVEANWERPKNDDANVEWVRDCLDDMRPFSDGSVYLNFPGFLEDGEDVMRTTFGSTYERLVALKDEYDPTNLFSLNQNVTPSGSTRTDGGASDE